MSKGGCPFCPSLTKILPVLFYGTTVLGFISGAAAHNGHFAAGATRIVHKVSGAGTVITAGAATGTIEACLGSASSSPFIQQFTVSGSALTGNITATAPAGFEVSLSADGGYGSSVTLVPSGGTVDSAQVYVRSAAGDPAGNISGDVVLASPGAVGQQVAVTGVVNAQPTVNPVSSQTLQTGSATAAVNFTGTAGTYTWTGTSGSIGLASSGSGNIASFTAVNVTAGPITDTITATPVNPAFAYIANQSSNNVSVINTVTGQVTATIDVGSEPIGVCLNASGSILYVANANDNTVSVINTATNQVTASYATGNFPTGEALSPNGSILYVSDQADGTITEYNTATGALLTTINIGTNVSGIVMAPGGGALYVSENAANLILVINTSTNTITANIPVGSGNPWGLTISPDGRTLYVGYNYNNIVTVINTSTNTVTANITVGTTSDVGPASVCLSPDGSTLYTCGLNDNSLTVINTATNAVTATYSNIGNMPYGMEASPQGGLLYISSNNANTESVVNPSTGAIVSTIAVGQGPGAVGSFITPGTDCAGSPATFTITVCPVVLSVDTTVAVCAGGTYTLPSGRIVGATGTYNDTVHFVATGCDSLVTLMNLTVLPTYTVDTVVTLCSGQVYTLPSGKTAGATGVYNDTVYYMVTGCDSLVTLMNLTVLPTYTVDTVVTLCSGQVYTLPSGKTAGATGVYNDTVHYVVTGCDSLVTQLNLTVLPTYTVDTVVTLCSGQVYTLPSGKTAGATGVYNDTVHYVVTGCDSLVTLLNLTVLPTYTVDTVVTLCSGQVYTLPSGKTAGATGVYNDTVHYVVTGCDSLVTQLSLTVLPTFTVDTTVTICSGQVYTLPSGKTENATGVYNDTVHYVVTGCDSLVTLLNLTVLPTYTVDTTATLCSGQIYTLPSGKTVGTTGVYNDTVHYVVTGCDSLVTLLNLTVLPTFTVDTTVTICSGQVYTLPSGKTENATGVYNDTVHYVVTGCDSLVTLLNLTVLPTYTVDTTATLCSGQIYTLPSGKTAGATGVYNDTVHYVVTGCDSLVTLLNLTVLPTYTVDTVVTLCSGQVYTLPSGKTAGATGVYNDTVHYVVTGCDSLVTLLNLTVLPTFTVDTTATLCSGQVYTLPSGKMVGATGVYNDTVHYVVTGCDSLVTLLNLTVLPTYTVDTVVTLCSGQIYTLPSGKTAGATGVYNDTVHYVVTGCDSLVTLLNLTVLPTYTVDTTATLCSGQIYTLPSGKTAGATGVYNDTVHYVVTGCDSLVTQLNLTVLPTYTVDTTVTVCSGQVYTLPSGKTAGATGVYNDTVHYVVTGCDSLVTLLNLTVLPTFTVDTTATLCSGQIYTLPSGKMVGATGVYNDTVYYLSTGCDSLVTLLNLTVLQMFTADTAITLCAGQIYTLPSGKTVGTTGTYNDTVYYVSTGCDSLVTTFNLTVLDTLHPVITVTPAGDSLCAGTPVTFTATPTGVGTFEWLLNGADVGTGNSFRISTLQNGDSVGCVLNETQLCALPDTSAAVYVLVYPLPLVAFNPDTVYVTAGASVPLAPEVTGAIVQYLWSPAAGLSPSDTAASPFVTPDGGTSMYRLQVTTVEGCMATGDVTVMEVPPLVMPSAFTPNGDGHNDVFRIPPGVQLNLEEFTIFDRWGKRVFETKDIDTGWDGTLNGFPQPIGAYVYFVKGTLPNGGTVRLKGTVVLMK